MTREHKYSIEPSEIGALRYECRNCHAAVSIPIEKIPTAQQLHQLCIGSCSYCQTGWGFHPNSEEARAFADFGVGLRKIVGALDSRNLKLSFEITCSEKE